MNSVQFLKQVWTPQQKPGLYFCLSTKTVQGKWKDHFFSSPVSRATLGKFIKDNKDKNLYFCPTPLKSKRRVKENVASSNVLWADLDEVHPRQCSIKPQVAWASSPNRYSSLWVLNKKHQPKKIESINRDLTMAVGADKAGWDLSQVLRIPGTRNYKYEKAPRGRLMWFRPSTSSITEFIGIEAVNGHRHEDPVALMKKLRSKIPAKCRRLLTSKTTKEGKRSDVLWYLERELNDAGLAESDIYTLLSNSVWNKFKERRNGDEQLKAEISKARSNDGASDKSNDSTARLAGAGESDNDPGVRRLSTVDPERVTWLWHPYIPRGKLTLLEGDPGLGKSWATMAIASNVSRRSSLPGQRKPSGGNVLIMSAEDGLADTIRPRLGSMGANLRRIYAVDRPITFDEDGLDFITEQIQIIRPKLVIVDPLVAYMGGGVDLHRANETREVMANLAHLADSQKTSILAVRHLTKGGRDKAIYRGIGSIDILAAARSVILVGRHPFRDQERVMVHIKSNLEAQGKSIRYRLRPNSNRPFRWLGLCDLKADEVMNESASADETHKPDVSESRNARRPKD